MALSSHLLKLAFGVWHVVYNILGFWPQTEIRLSGVFLVGRGGDIRTLNKTLHNCVMVSVA